MLESCVLFMPGNHWFLLPFIEKSCLFRVFLSSIIDVYWFSTERQLLLSFIHGKLWNVIDFPLKIIKSYRFSIDLFQWFVTENHGVSDFSQWDSMIYEWLAIAKHCFFTDLSLNSIVCIDISLKISDFYLFPIENPCGFSIDNYSLLISHQQ